MIDHVSVGTTDIERSRRFYGPLMRLLGLALIKDTGTALHFGSGDIAFSVETPVDGAPASAGNGVHVAFRARGRDAVREFHALALANGGRDGGAPGIRSQYDAHYYGAFALDPDGNKIEAVTFSAD